MCHTNLAKREVPMLMVNKLSRPCFFGGRAANHLSPPPHPCPLFRDVYGATGRQDDRTRVVPYAPVFRCPHRAVQRHPEEKYIQDGHYKIKTMIFMMGIEQEKKKRGICAVALRKANQRSGRRLGVSSQLKRIIAPKVAGTASAMPHMSTMVSNLR
jgi:hypothetical protein